MDDFELDTDLLGLQHELISTLSEHGFNWFEHFSNVEVDMGNGELKVVLICDYTDVKEILEEFGRQNNFVKVFYSADRGAVYMRRRNDPPRKKA